MKPEPAHTRPRHDLKSTLGSPQACDQCGAVRIAFVVCEDKDGERSLCQACWANPKAAS